MGLKICSFASGSTGNCIYVSSERTKLLIDIGISVRRVEACLQAVGAGPEGISVLLTHSHIDHIKDVPAFAAKYGCDVYVHPRTAGRLRLKMNGKNGRLIEFDDSDFFIGDITVSPFCVPHDVHCCGYSLYNEGRKLSFATDLGFAAPDFIDRIKDSGMVFLESNHDLELLRSSKKYPQRLKARIMSHKGHLSNHDCARAALELARSGVGHMMLGHLSLENNYPELAYSTVSSLLSLSGYAEGRDIKIDVATHCDMSGLIEVPENRFRQIDFFASGKEESAEENMPLLKLLPER